MYKGHKISIAMTTFNGAKHLFEQLDSVYSQSLSPDEVVICDDGSSDTTGIIINQYIKERNLHNWIFLVNKERLGWKENFRKSISQTNGDIIFFADQDDIWLPDKIEKMSKLMVEKNMGCLYGDSVKIDDTGAELRSRNEKNSFSGSIVQIPLTKSFYTVGGLGCCMCVSRRVINRYLELDCKNDDHDSQCPRIAILFDSLWRLDAPVIKYRIYAGNTSGISSNYSYGTSNLEKRIEEIHVIKDWLKAVNTNLGENEPEGAAIKSLVKNAYKVENLRDNYLSGNKKSIFSLLKYKGSYSGMTMLVGDFAYKHRINKLFGKVRWNILKLLKL